MFLAAATANLRVRAGEHFYSDVLVGALVGAGLGTAIPALHTDGVYAPSGAEWAAIAGGLVAGVTLSELLPLGSARVTTEVAPLVAPDTTGIAIVGTF
jgi:hypothetical protein